MAQSFQPSNIIEFNGNQHKDVFFNGYEHKEAWMDINGELCCVWKRTSREHNHIKVMTLLYSEYPITTMFARERMYITHDKVVFCLYGMGSGTVGAHDIATITVDIDTESVHTVHCEDYSLSTIGCTAIAQNFWSIGTENCWEEYDKISDSLNGDLTLEVSFVESGGGFSWGYPRDNPPRRFSHVEDDTFIKLGVNGYRINTAVNHTMVIDGIKIHNDETSMETSSNYFQLSSMIGDGVHKVERGALGLQAYAKNNHIILYTSGNEGRHGEAYWTRICKYDPASTGSRYDYQYNGIFMGFPYKGQINLNTGDGIYYLQFGNYPSDTYYDVTHYYENVIGYLSVSRDYAIKNIKTMYYTESDSTYHTENKTYLIKYGVNLNSELKTWDISDMTGAPTIAHEISRPNNTTSIIVTNTYYAVGENVYRLESLPSGDRMYRTALGYAYSEILGCDYVLVNAYTYETITGQRIDSYECYKLVEGKYTLLNVDFSSLLETEAETGFHGGITRYANGFWYFINQESSTRNTTIMRFNLPELNVYKGE